MKTEKDKYVHFYDMNGIYCEVSFFFPFLFKCPLKPNKEMSSLYPCKRLPFV